MARDGNSYTEGSKTRDRNALLSAAFAMAHESMAQRGAVAAGFFNPIPNPDPYPSPDPYPNPHAHAHAHAHAHTQA